MANRLCETTALTVIAVAALLTLLAAAPGTPFAASAAAKGCGPAANANPSRVKPSEARDAVTCLVNKQRNKAGLGDLDRDKRLQRAAQRHTEKMDGSGCFDHTCGGEGDLGTRLESVDYIGGDLSHWSYGENIAWGMRGRGTARAIVDAWMHSSGTGPTSSATTSTISESASSRAARTPPAPPAPSTRWTSASGSAEHAPTPPRGGHWSYDRGLRGRGVTGCTSAFQAERTGSSPVARFTIRRGVESPAHGAWRSLVAHSAGGRAVAGSNPVAPTSESPLRKRALVAVDDSDHAHGGGRGTGRGTALGSDRLRRLLILLG